MGLMDFANKKGFKTFMARLYGWGAALVIMGALFKINHWEGATVMLALGMITEAVIFFFSAFEKPHVEVNWSAVYPELAPQYGGEAIAGQPGSHARTTSHVSQSQPMNELNQMFKEAGVDTHVIREFSDGLKKFSENAQQMASLSSVTAANDTFIGSVKKAAANLDALSDVYAQQLKNVSAQPALNNKLQQTMDELSNKLQTTVGEFSTQVKSSTEYVSSYQQQMKALTGNMTALNNIYGNMLSAMSPK